MSPAKPQEADSAAASSIAQPDLTAAASAVETAGSVADAAFKQLAAAGDVDADQVLAYDLAHAAAAVENARAVLGYGEKGDEEARIACAFVADVVHDVATRLMGREQEWGAERGALDSALDFARPYRSPEFLSDLCGTQGPRHLDDDFVMVQDTFRRFAEERAARSASAARWSPVPRSSRERSWLADQRRQDLVHEEALLTFPWVT